MSARDAATAGDVALPVGVGLLAGTGIVLARRPGVRSALAHSIKSIGKGGSRAVAATEALPPEVVTQAKAIAQGLRKSGIDPSKARIAIVATPGTGKSTLARALQQEAGVQVLNLDKARGGGLKGERALRYLRDQHGGVMPAGAVLEQTYLPHSVSLDQFDAVIKLERPVEEIHKSLLKRGKGAFQMDYVDYEKLQKQLREGFGAIKGKELSFGGRAQVKIRGAESFNMERGLAERAQRLGLDLGEFSALTRPQQLASLAEGKIVKSHGVTSTYRRGRILTDAALPLAGAGVGAAYAFNKSAAAQGEDNTRRNALIGAGAGLAAGAALTLARRPGLRAHLRAKGKSLFASGTEKALAKENISGEIPQDAVEQARKLIASLRRQGYTPDQIKNMRFGVVGTSGTGKSTVARALEKELGVKRVALDTHMSFFNPRKMGNVDADAALKAQGGMKPGTVAEQTQLLHSADPGQFDVLIKVERPADVIRKDLIRRGHAAVTADYTDFNKAQRTVNEAFTTAGGRRVQITPGMEVRVKPAAGTDALYNRVQRARELNLDIERFKQLDQRDQIQSLAEGKIVKRTWRAHISSGKAEQDLGIGAALALAGAGAGVYSAKKTGGST
jgi:broad-specificity NMP kinase